MNRDTMEEDFPSMRVILTERREEAARRQSGGLRKGGGLCRSARTVA